MTSRLARRVLALYPLAFRRRYGEEMQALLEQALPGPMDLLDLLRGALLAHLRLPASTADSVDPASRLRASTSGVLACCVLFAAAGLGFLKTTEDVAFSTAGHAHPLLGDAHLAVQVMAMIGFGAVILGALPLMATALVRSRRDPLLRRVVARPVVPVIAFGVLTAAVVLIAHGQPPHHTSAAGSAAGAVWGIAGLSCGLACALRSRTALFAVPVAPARLRWALAFGTVVTVAMLAIALASAVYACGLMLDSARLAASPNGPFQVLSTSASLIALVIAMLVAGALATTAARRGWRVAKQLGSSAPV